jgi:hypothetical protein
MPNNNLLPDVIQTEWKMNCVFSTFLFSKKNDALYVIKQTLIVFIVHL